MIGLILTFVLPISCCNQKTDCEDDETKFLSNIKNNSSQPITIEFFNFYQEDFSQMVNPNTSSNNCEFFENSFTGSHCYDSIVIKFPN